MDELSKTWCRVVCSVILLSQLQNARLKKWMYCVITNHPVSKSCLFCLFNMWEMEGGNKKEQKNTSEEQNNVHTGCHPQFAAWIEGDDKCEHCFVLVSEAEACLFLSWSFSLTAVIWKTYFGLMIFLFGCYSCFSMTALYEIYFADRVISVSVAFSFHSKTREIVKLHMFWLAFMGPSMVTLLSFPWLLPLPAQTALR